MATFGYAAQELDKLGLAYLHVIEPRVSGDGSIERDSPAIAAASIRPHFRGPIIAAGGFSPEAAEAIVSTGDADLVAFGRSFIANPDLPKRIRAGLPFNAYDRDTFYGGDARGYTDYPFYDPRVAKTG
jgi:N-ethylmaleimide reductase